MTTEKEFRAGVPVEIREDDGDTVLVEGYAAVFGERANIAGVFEEEIAPGAFSDADMSDVPFLIEHSGLPLARTSSGTLSLSVDTRGLKVSTRLDPSDPDVARILPKMRRGDLSKMSFAFTAEREEWDDTGEIPLRSIKAFRRLYDVAIVTTPAFAGTEIGLRSLEAARAEARANPAARRARMRMRLALNA